MHWLATLSDNILKILRTELSYLIRDKVFNSHKSFQVNLGRFADTCLQDTHPELKMNLIDDPELYDYMFHLKSYVNFGGFRGKQNNFECFYQLLILNYFFIDMFNDDTESFKQYSSSTSSYGST